ncbi:hypothetical protein [Chromobacterium haemolyticum]|uniref:Phosphodiesterase n=1 Tax=Chromobacterium haemolyticum TaxID=394935 RepID=A0A1W0CV11_9NEIS|nr:hypothetical protein [Chromobacterium haemolyticum]OQS38637.1 hypothetical protein B0T45_12720 [Chromobacterium haemolyticum]
MQLLAHRGLWTQSKEKNSLQALSASFDLGIGIETDVRDCNGTLVISHDAPLADKVFSLEALLLAYIESSTRPMLALNIKADGLQAQLLEMLEKYSIDNYFVFDMSVPDTLGYQHLSMPFAARISEYEPSNVLAKTAGWIWLDAFLNEWYDPAIIQHWLDQGKKVAVVSSELHRRPHLALWQSLKFLHDHPGLYLCTDLVAQATEFFDANKY